jgi:peptidoglycan/xylan/chitin deacetylase (PgdA/CDA1 family)
MPVWRVDRLASVYLFHPVHRLLPSGSLAIPILMYHGIPANRTGSRNSYYSVDTDRAVFGAHMKLLHDEGYRTIGLAEAWTMARGDATPTRCAVITFDDGFQDFHRNACPVLAEYGFTATMFLPVAYIGGTFKDAACLTWDEVRELRRAGIEFGSHTVRHPQLRTLAPDKVAEEVRSSKEQIEDQIGCAVKSFSYPYAFPETDRTFVPALRGMLQDAGYENGVSTVIGRLEKSCDRMFMRRLPMNSYDDSQFFRAKLEGGYDWLHAIQYAFKAAH